MGEGPSYFVENPNAVIHLFFFFSGTVLSKEEFSNICFSVWVCVCARLHVCMYICVCKCVYVCICLCMCICTCVCMCVCVSRENLPHRLICEHFVLPIGGRREETAEALSGPYTSVDITCLFPCSSALLYAWCCQI